MVIKLKMLGIRIGVSLFTFLIFICMGLVYSLATLINHNIGGLKITMDEVNFCEFESDSKEARC